MMREGAPKTIYRKDYTEPDFLISHVELAFVIDQGNTRVTSSLRIQRNGTHNRPLVLDGEGLGLVSASIDDSGLDENAFKYVGGKLTVDTVPNQFVFGAVVDIQPEANSSLEGLYRSRTMYCTQCEAEGYRKITFGLDRPDVLSTYTVTLSADKATCPVLLSNGNEVSRMDLVDGRHQVVWHDPHPKPSYLFALVAGDLELVSDTFSTQSGKVVDLRIWVEAKDTGYCDHAMNSLKASMRWDEERYGLEYDLDLFNIVAVDDFNMGAMENKSLNIFNTSCVLAHPDITTDLGYQRVESVVAHEYFHNYSGNRVTCRDWFQLSLKEGFTVFRDAEFSADMNSRGVKRIEDVSFLQTHQFAEDSGPMAHPVRPDSFIEISNFYTMTVYEKGAEVVRMLNTLLGDDAFYAGAKLYFNRFDGMAVTCDHFVDAMQEASCRDLSQFRRWYEQAGTPVVSIEKSFDEASGKLDLTFSQMNPPTPGQDNKPPLHIPLTLALIEQGEHVDMGNGATSRVVELTESTQTFTFEGLGSQPVISALRGFSAPVRLNMDQSQDDLIALMGSDNDPFVRWDASQRLAYAAIDAGAKALERDYVDALRQVLSSDIEDAMKAQLLSLPTEASLADRAAQTGLVNVHDIHNAKTDMAAAVGHALSNELEAIVMSSLAVTDAYEPSAEQIGRRSLLHTAMSLLVESDPEWLITTRNMYYDATNLSDRLCAARLVVHQGDEAHRAEVLEHFFNRWQSENLVVNQWFVMQATRPSEDCVSDVTSLTEHMAFDWRNPNKVRSLISAFAGANPIGFHALGGGGYRLLGEAVRRLQSDNPQIAARMLAPMTRWRRYDHGQSAMRGELESIAALEGLSQDVYEVVNRSLKEV
jgi:aminopeptidase N